MSRASKNFGHLFSTQSEAYAKYRPTYPRDLYDRITTFGWKGRTGGSIDGLVVDVGCGTGQATIEMASRFTRVIGCDPSKRQLANAVTADNVEYKQALCDSLPVEDCSVSCVTCGQAAHWFDLPPFYKELERVLAPDGVVAIWGFSLVRIEEPPAETESETDTAARLERQNKANEEFLKFHNDDLGEYWAPERKLLDAQYLHIDLPFERKERQTFEFVKDMSLEGLFGYISSWSGLNTWIKKHPEADATPLDALSEKYAVLYPRLIAIYGSKDTTVRLAHPTVLLLGQKGASE